MPISRALLKHGYSNFSLEILEEYCSASKLLERENYYIKSLEPEYNICKEAYSSFGRVASEETKARVSDSQPTRIKIEVTDLETNNLTRDLNILQYSITKYFKNKQQKPYKGSGRQLYFQKIIKGV